MKITTAILLALPLSACDPAVGGQSNSSGESSRPEPTPFVENDVPSFTSPAPRPANNGAIGVETSLPVRLTALRTAAEPPPPISGGSLAVSADGSRVVAADPDRDMIYVVDMAALRVDKLALARGSEPGRVALDDAGGAHVALRGSGKLVRIDLATARVARESPLCKQPRGLAFDRKNQTLLASCMDGQLVTLDPVTHHEQARATLPHDLRDVVVNAAGQRSVARYRSAELLSLQAGDSVRSMARPTSVDARSAFAGLPDDITRLLSDAGVGFATSSTQASPTLAWRALASPSGNTWMLHQRSRDGEVAITRGGYGSGCDAITTGAITEFGSDGMPTRSMPIALQGLSVDLALSPDEKWLALASPGGFVGGKPTLQVYATSAMQAQPSALGCSSTSATASAGLESQIVAVTFGADGLLYALSREPAQLTVYRLEASNFPTGVTRTATLSLHSSSVRDTGHDIFHADVGRGLACASCHGEALDDGHVWNFQKIGPRRTQNIRGGLLGTAPFHWDGDMPNIGHLIDDVMTGRMGGFAIDTTYVSALGQWIDQQPALSLPMADATAVARGKQLFESDEAACASCHSGPALTNNESADVGTGGKFQVPGLLGLGLRAPYMHNGCAPTLRERFTPACGGDKHGNTAQLSEAQRADLVAYLSSL